MSTYLSPADLRSIDSNTYEMRAWRAGHAYYRENPSAEGTWGTDAGGKALYLLDVPGFHLLWNTYNLWFRMGYTAAMQGRSTVVGAVTFGTAKLTAKHAAYGIGAGVGLALVYKMFSKKRGR